VLFLFQKVGEERSMAKTRMYEDTVKRRLLSLKGAAEKRAPLQLPLFSSRSMLKLEVMSRRAKGDKDGR
jgi:hypothetical protein